MDAREKVAIVVTALAGLTVIGLWFFVLPAALVALLTTTGFLIGAPRSPVLWACVALDLALLIFGATVFTFGN